MISRALYFNLSNLTSYYAKEKSLSLLHTLSEIFDVLNIPAIEENPKYSPPIEVILNLTNGTVEYFFSCCKEEGML